MQMQTLTPKPLIPREALERFIRAWSRHYRIGKCILNPTPMTYADESAEHDWVRQISPRLFDGLRDEFGFRERIIQRTAEAMWSFERLCDKFPSEGDISAHDWAFRLAYAMGELSELELRRWVRSSPRRAAYFANETRPSPAWIDRAEWAVEAECRDTIPLILAALQR